MEKKMGLKTQELPDFLKPFAENGVFLAGLGAENP
jgi:hypothetical protein